MTRANCSYCGRKGIPLYPVRYAVACPNGAAAVPELSGSFKIVGAPAQIGSARYTLRSLRTGYLYTYEEKRKRLKGYVVLPKGGLWNFPVEYPPNFDVGYLPERCLDPVDISLSHCIDVEPFECELIGNVWIGWSNTAWTPNLIAKVKDDAWRRKHMQCIDVNAMMSGGTAHTAEFDDAMGKIPHFSTSLSDMEKAFAYSNSDVKRESSLRNWGTRISSNMRKLRPQGGFVVAVNDPIGITNDLSELTCPTHHSGFDEVAYRAHMCLDLIGAIERSVRAEARADAQVLEEIDKTAETRGDISEGEAAAKLWEIIKAGGQRKYEARRDQDKRKYGEAQAGRLRAAEDRAWRDFSTNASGTNILDETRIKQHPQDFQRAVKNFEGRGLMLAQAHSGWLTSAQLADWMDGVHDSSDIRSGFAYRESLAQCIGKGVATVACESALRGWLDKTDVTDTRNLYVRALLFNYTEILDAAGPQLMFTDVKIKYLQSIYKGALKKLKKGEEIRLVDRLVWATTNILCDVLTKKSTPAMRGITIASLSILGRATITPYNRSLDNLSKEIIAVAKANGVIFDKPLVHIGEASRKVSKAVRLEYEADPTVCRYQLDIEQIAKDKNVTTSSVKSVRIMGYETLKNWLGSSDFNVGAVAVVIQLANLALYGRDFGRGDAFDRGKDAAKVVSAAISFVGATIEAVGTCLDKAPQHPLSTFIYEHWTVIKTSNVGKIVTLGKALGAIGGVLNAAIDVVNGCSAFLEEDFLLASLYGVSALLGGSLSLAGFWMSAVIFWYLFVAAIVLGIIIGILKKPPLKKWMERCFFSSSIGQPKIYASVDEELQAYNSVVGAF